MKIVSAQAVRLAGEQDGEYNTDIRDPNSNIWVIMNIQCRHDNNIFLRTAAYDGTTLHWCTYSEYVHPYSTEVRRDIASSKLLFVELQEHELFYRERKLLDECFKNFIILKAYGKEKKKKNPYRGGKGGFVTSI